ncbi:MAG: GcrA family cell cycle regulator [Paracoccus sp. (in: a-proteobacteria)]|uniref:GcrA family cell cycle regulator n=1 Tax=Paracoccus sp. TaxID=267 RepID=UPI0026DF4CD7|nr:GcrA family cell cycle regulator [Paracoccus sp. (in: a-proteobacteria)]MDO5622155.1 GcrA family cell cycle regulator [Paracoccus sp. (in: a-proteobacteria)]
MSWTDERVETLKRMWSEGQSASQIAKELGGVTRNAVIGKVHRLGLSNRNDEAETKPEPAPAPVSEPAPAPAKAEKPKTKAKAAPQPAPEPTPAPEPEVEQAEPEPTPPVPAFNPRRNIIPAGQPLPPQPSANEIPEETLATAREVEKKARKLSLMELTERTCKWPIGDPATDKFWFCGLPSAPGKPYCETHVAVAFQPASARRDRRR